MDVADNNVSAAPGPSGLSGESIIKLVVSSSCSPSCLRDVEISRLGRGDPPLPNINVLQFLDLFEPSTPANRFTVVSGELRARRFPVTSPKVSEGPKIVTL